MQHTHIGGDDLNTSKRYSGSKFPTRVEFKSKRSSQNALPVADYGRIFLQSDFAKIKYQLNQLLMCSFSFIPWFKRWDCTKILLFDGNVRRWQVGLAGLTCVACIVLYGLCRKMNGKLERERGESFLIDCMCSERKKLWMYPRIMTINHTETHIHTSKFG